VNESIIITFILINSQRLIF